MNNNADASSDPSTDNSDRFKASIYESLKNGLLNKDKNHTGSKPGDLPFKNLHVGKVRKPPVVGAEASRLPSESTQSVNNASTNKSPGNNQGGVLSAPISPNLPVSSPSPASSVKVGGGSAIRSPSKPIDGSGATVLLANSKAPSSSSSIAVAANHLRPAVVAVDANNSSSVMRLMTQHQQPHNHHTTLANNSHSPQHSNSGGSPNPVSLGRTSVTITRTPRTTATTHHNQQLLVTSNPSLLSSSFHDNNSQTSLTLTPATIVTASHMQHQQQPVRLGMGGAHSPPGNGSHKRRSPGVANHLTVQPVTVALHNNSPTHGSAAASIQQFSPSSSSPYAIKQSIAGPTTLIIPQAGSAGRGAGNILQHATKFQHPGAHPGNNHHVSAPISPSSARQLLIAVTSAGPIAQQRLAPATVIDNGPVNLCVKRPLSIDEESDHGGRGARSCKGKRYQEFIEDGRITVGGGAGAVGGAKKRRSHRSGDSGAEETALNLSTTGGSGGGGGSNNSGSEFNGIGGGAGMNGAATGYASGGRPGGKS